MDIEHQIRILAGTLVLIGTALGLLASPWWFALTIFVGLNLLQSGFTGFCPAEMMLRAYRKHKNARIGGFP